MPIDKLTPTQEAWCLRASAVQIANKVKDTTIPVALLEELAARKPIFSAKLRELKTLVASMPNPKEEEDYKAVMALVATDPFGEETGRLLAKYKTDWSGAANAAERLAAVESALAANAEARKGEIEARWNALHGADGKITDIDALKDFISANPTYAPRADHELWEWAMRQADGIAAIDTYLSLVGPQAAHALEASSYKAAMSQWSSINHNDFNAVLAFITDHANELIANAARNCLSSLKESELDAIRRNRIGYRQRRFQDLWESGVFTQEELCEAAGLDDAAFERIVHYDEVRARLSDIPTPSVSAGAPGVTDVIFFGIPSSGKSCILTGLFNADNMDFDRVNWNGTYATALQNYGIAGMAPPPTSDDTVALVKSTVLSGKMSYHFNLVDMAGEAYNRKITQIDNDSSIETSFADMGEGAPEVLASDNDKVFFIVLDATADATRHDMQRVALNNLISLMFGSPDTPNPNEEIMKRVSALHFIVTKADTLDSPRLENARSLLHQLINSTRRKYIVDSCRKYGINATGNAETDGVPRLFCFSLGTFHIGNTFTYDPTDSMHLLEVIRDHVMPTKSSGIMYKVRKFFTTPFI